MVSVFEVKITVGASVTLRPGHTRHQNPVPVPCPLPPFSWFFNKGKRTVLYELKMGPIPWPPSDALLPAILRVTKLKAQRLDPNLTLGC